MPKSAIYRSTAEGIELIKDKMAEGGSWYDPVNSEYVSRDTYNRKDFAAQVANISYSNFVDLLNGKFISAKLFKAAFVNSGIASWERYAIKENGERLVTNVSDPINIETSPNNSTSQPKQIRYTEHTEIFKRFIDYRLGTFVGRQYIFDEFHKRQKDTSSGYISIVGNPGDGKSAIAANYLQRNPENNIFYFNIRGKQINTVSGYLKAMCNQLNDQFGLGMSLDNPDYWTNGALFNEILDRVGYRLKNASRKLTIVVDALDEAEYMQTGPGKPNPLYLPECLPDNVYFLLTRRKTFELNRMCFNTHKILDLTSQEYKLQIAQDVTLYLQNYLSDSKKGTNLYNHIKKLAITPSDFIDLMVEKSKGNFMYLTLVTEDIYKGVYQNLEDLSRLPETLEGYYEDHWMLLDMDNHPERRLVLRAFLDSEIPISIELVSKIMRKKIMT